jgi:hypothetical protein
MGKLKEIAIEAENTGEDPDVLLMKKALENTPFFSQKLLLICKSLNMDPTGKNINKILLKAYQCLR